MRSKKPIITSWAIVAAIVVTLSGCPDMFGSSDDVDNDGNEAPVANAGTDQEVEHGASITLDGTGSTDADDDTLTYEWAFTEVPAASTIESGDITNLNTATATFAPDAAGIYTLRLTVGDGDLSNSDVVLVTVIESDSEATEDDDEEEPDNEPDDVEVEDDPNDDPEEIEDPTYTVRYEAGESDGGTVPTDDTEYGEDDAVMVEDNAGGLTRNGFVFAGWNTAEDGSGTEYGAGESFTIDADTTLYAQWEPEDIDDQTEVPDSSEYRTALVVANAADYDGDEIPKDFNLSIDYEIDDDDWSSANTYEVIASFVGHNGPIEMDVIPVATQTGTLTPVFSIFETGLPDDVEVPYTLYFELHDITNTAVLGETEGITMTRGQFTADYQGYIHNYELNSYVEILMSLAQYGDIVVGTMTAADDPGDVVVAIDATASEDTLGMALEGSGELEGSTTEGTVIMEGSADSYGDGLHLNCANYYLEGSGSPRGEFFVDRLGTATVSGTVRIPEAQADAIHTALDGKTWTPYLMFDFSAEDDGGVGWIELVWNGNESMVYTIENVPAGEYSVVFLSDCNEDDNDQPTNGDCFGIAGMSAADAGDLLATMYSETIPTNAPTITVEEGQSVTAEDIELGLVVDLPAAN